MRKRLFIFLLCHTKAISFTPSEKRLCNSRLLRSALRYNKLFEASAHRTRDSRLQAFRQKLASWPEKFLDSTTVCEVAALVTRQKKGIRLTRQVVAADIR